MKIAWTTVYNAQDPADYDGRGYYLPKSLEMQGIDVSYVGNLKVPNLYKPVIKLKKRIYENNVDFLKPYLPYKTYHHLFEPFVLKSYAHQISKGLSQSKNIDFVFSGVCLYLQPIAYLDCKQPLITWTDTPMIGALDFYPGNGRNEVSPEYIKNGIACDKAAYHRADLVLFASEWAAQTAISHYQLPSEKVKVVPFGSNIPSNYSHAETLAAIEARPSSHCKLMFLGYDWQRKGGDLALEVTSKLNQAGLTTELTIVGCNPPIEPSLASQVRCLNKISNASPEGINQLQKLLLDSHFLILPTQAESFGHVFCEANSFGVPSLASNVGGIPTIIKDNVNGKKFSKDAKAEEYCEYISSLFENYSQYKELARSSLHEYETRLNWATSGKLIKSFLQEMMILLIISLNIKLTGTKLLNIHPPKTKCLPPSIALVESFAVEAA